MSEIFHLFDHPDYRQHRPPFFWTENGRILQRSLRQNGRGKGILVRPSEYESLAGDLENEITRSLANGDTKGETNFRARLHDFKLALQSLLRD